MARFIPTDDHTFEFVNETYFTSCSQDSGRKIVALNTNTSESVECAKCRKPILRNPFVGAQYTYDREEYTPLCIKCAMEMNIIHTWPPPAPLLVLAEDEEDDDLEVDLMEEIKRGRGRPPGSKNKPKETIPEAVTETKKKENTRMGIMDLKSKLAGKKPAAAAVAAPTTKVAVAKIAPKPAPVAAMELEEDDDEEEDEEVATVSTPATLRQKADNVDVARKSAGSGLSKAEVAEIMRMVMAEFGKTVDEKLKLVKKHVSEEITAIKNTLDQQSKDHAAVVEAMSTSFNELTEILVGVIGGGEEEAAEEEAAPEETPEPAPEPAAKIKKTKAAPTPEPTPTSAALPAKKKPFAEFVAEQAGEEGIHVTTLADLSCEAGYFTTMPEDQEVRDQSLISVLKKDKYKGKFNIDDDGLVTVA